MRSIKKVTLTLQNSKRGGCHVGHREEGWGTPKRCVEQVLLQELQVRPQWQGYSQADLRSHPVPSSGVGVGVYCGRMVWEVRDGDKGWGCPEPSTFPTVPRLPLCRLPGDSKVTFFPNLKNFAVKVREAHPETENDKQGARLEGSPGVPAGKGGPGGRGRLPGEKIT